MRIGKRPPGKPHRTTYPPPIPKSAMSVTYPEMSTYAPANISPQRIVGFYPYKECVPSCTKTHRGLLVGMESSRKSTKQPSRMNPQFENEIKCEKQDSRKS